MIPVSATTDSSAVDSVGILLSRLELHKLEQVSNSVRCDPSAISKFINDKGAITAGTLRALLEFAGLKMVDKSRTCVRREEITLLRRVYAAAQDRAPWLLDEAEA